MPIILLWNDAAILRSDQVGRWLDEIAGSTLLLGTWLRRRVEEAERLDRMSANIPVFRFYNTALTARVADVQFGALLTQPVASVGDHVERALERWNVVREVRTQVRAARLPSNALQVVAEMAEGILASLVRFAQPKPEMFAPHGHTASDLIGLGALAYRAIGAHRDGFVGAARRLKAGLATGTPEAEKSWRRRRAPSAATADAGLPLALSLDQLLRYVVGGILIIPALSALLQTIGRDGLAALQFGLLEKLEQIEVHIHGFRQRLLVGFRNGLQAIAEAALQFLERVTGFAVDSLRSFARIGLAYVDGVTAGITIFIDQLQTFWGGVKVTVERILAYATAITAIDIGDLIHRILVTAQETIEYLTTMFYGWIDAPDEYKAPERFPVTIGEMVLKKDAGERANREVNTAIDRVVAAYRGVPTMKLYSPLIRKVSDQKVDLNTIIGALESIGRTLATKHDVPQQPELKLDATALPDLVAEVVTPLQQGLDRAVEAAGTGMQMQIGDIFTVAGAALDDTSRAFEGASAGAARTGSTRLLQHFIGDPDALMRSMFAGQDAGSRAPSCSRRRMSSPTGWCRAASIRSAASWRAISASSSTSGWSISPRAATRRPRSTGRRRRCRPRRSG